ARSGTLRALSSAEGGSRREGNGKRLTADVLGEDRSYLLLGIGLEPGAAGATRRPGTGHKLGVSERGSDPSWRRRVAATDPCGSGTAARVAIASREDLGFGEQDHIPPPRTPASQRTPSELDNS
ncbi:hypothetical protein THAOC_27158, partial [Thalassiosira oceanica]